MPLALVRRPPLEPSPANLRKVERIFAALGPPMFLTLRWWQRLEVVGREHFPRTGPVILLPNHVTWFDPLTMMAAVRRPVHFMAGEGLFHEPVTGLLARWAGAVPRRKFVADMKSVRMLSRWAKAGGAVGIFPEAERTWDGHTQPLVPAIGRLVQSFGHPVVTARIIGGYRQNPRWGNQRRGKLRIELDPPERFGKGDDPAEIEAWLSERIAVPADSGTGWPMSGRRLAEGVTNVLYRCPTCDTLDALVEQGDDLRCTACEAGWRLDIDHHLHPRQGGPALRLRDLLAHLRATAGDAAHLSDGVVLRSGPMTLLDISGEVSTEVGRGHLVLTPDRLSVEGTTWSLPLAEISTIHVFMQRRLMIRAGQQLWEAVLPDPSVVKWQWVTEAWMRRP